MVTRLVQCVLRELLYGGADLAQVRQARVDNGSTADVTREESITTTTKLRCSPGWWVVHRRRDARLRGRITRFRNGRKRHLYCLPGMFSGEGGRIQVAPKLHGARSSIGHVPP